MEYSIGELIDKLSIVNIKIFHLVDIIQEDQDNDKVASSARNAQSLNKERSKMINQINKILGDLQEDVKI